MMVASVESQRAKNSTSAMLPSKSAALARSVAGSVPAFASALTRIRVPAGSSDTESAPASINASENVSACGQSSSRVIECQATGLFLLLRLFGELLLEVAVERLEVAPLVHGLRGEEDLARAVRRRADQAARAEAEITIPDSTPTTDSPQAVCL